MVADAAFENPPAWSRFPQFDTASTSPIEVKLEMRLAKHRHEQNAQFVRPVCPGEVSRH